VEGSGRRDFAAEVSCDLPSLAPGGTALIDVTVKGGAGRRPGNGVAGVVQPVHRTRRRRVVEQHGAGAGAEHLWRDFRSRSGDTVGGGDEAKGAVMPRQSKSKVPGVRRSPSAVASRA